MCNFKKKTDNFLYFKYNKVIYKKLSDLVFFLNEF